MVIHGSPFLKTAIIPLLIFLSLQGLNGVPAYSQDESIPPAYDGYEDVLAAYVNDKGLVDYRGLKKNSGRLESFVREIGLLPRERYEAWPSKDRIAFLINAYNALTLKAIIDHYPIRVTTRDAPEASIRQIQGVWDELAFEVMGRRITLNHIEHEILRKQFDEPRIHMALVCAAKSCPGLRNEPYRGKSLDAQLEDQTRKFLAHPAKFRIERGNDRVYLSEIFKWFGKDFVRSHGTSSGFKGRSETERAVMNFIAKHIDMAGAEYLSREEYTIAYLPYDWSLNER